MSKLITLIAVCGGGALGWNLGSPWGIMSSYLLSVCGSSAGLFVAKKLQHHLDDD